MTFPKIHMYRGWLGATPLCTAIFGKVVGGTGCLTTTFTSLEPQFGPPPEFRWRNRAQRESAGIAADRSKENKGLMRVVWIPVLRMRTL